jgi:hypothetical protein
LIDAEFEAFVKADPLARKGPPCLVCTLPSELLDWVRRKVAEGKGYSQLARFVRSKGHKVADGTLARHFRDTHDAR